MAQSSSRLPAHLQSRSKTVPILGSSFVNAKDAETPPPLSRPSSRSRQSSPVGSFSSIEISDKSTAALVRRVLCPNAYGNSGELRPIEELLPPLTSSNEIDLQLYAIIAVVVKEFVQSWYSKVTPDQGFVEELVRIIAHCTRALEGRLRSLDLEGLMFDEIPELVEGHIVAYRVCHQQTPPCLSIDPHIIYHNLNPHPALSPAPDPNQESALREQLKNEAAYRQLLVHGALAILLPTEELENPCVRTLVADVIGDAILGNIIGSKVSQGWFIWGSIIKVADVIKANLEPRTAGEKIEVDTRSRFEKFGLLSERGQSTKPSDYSQRSVLTTLCWRILQYGYWTCLAIRYVVLGLVAASSQAPRSSPVPGIAHDAHPPPIAKIIEPPIPRRPLLNFRVFSLICIALNLPLRMPWLSGSLSLLQHQLVHGPFPIGAINGLLDRYISHLLRTHLAPSTLLPALLRSFRQSLFPHSSLRPRSASSSPPSPAQQAALKTMCARSIVSLVPTPILTRFFSTKDPDAIQEDVERELDVWSDDYLNRHLVYAVLELVVVRVLPELGEKGVRDLVEGRVGEEG